MNYTLGDRVRHRLLPEKTGVAVEYIEDGTAGPHTRVRLEDGSELIDSYEEFEPVEADGVRHIIGIKVVALNLLAAGVLLWARSPI